MREWSALKVNNLALASPFGSQFVVAMGKHTGIHAKQKVEELKYTPKGHVSEIRINEKIVTDLLFAFITLNYELLQQRRR